MYEVSEKTHNSLQSINYVEVVVFTPLIRICGQSSQTWVVKAGRGLKVGEIQAIVHKNLPKLKIT